MPLKINIPVVSINVGKRGTLLYFRYSFKIGKKKISPIIKDIKDIKLKNKNGRSSFISIIIVFNILTPSLYVDSLE